MSICYAARSVTSERSIQDKGFSLKGGKISESISNLSHSQKDTNQMTNPSAVWSLSIWIKVKSLQQILPQHQSAYLRGPESASIEIPPFRKH